MFVVISRAYVDLFNRQINFHRNTVMCLVSSTETPRRRQDTSDILSLLKFHKKYNFLFSFPAISQRFQEFYNAGISLGECIVFGLNPKLNI